jgi:hypothetical protein
VWPQEPGVYLFYGYPNNMEMDVSPRCVLVVAERLTDTFGMLYRTPRSTLKENTGATGVFMPLMVPSEFPALSDMERMGEEAIERAKKHRAKKLNKELARRLV